MEKIKEIQIRFKKFIKKYLFLIREDPLLRILAITAIMVFLLSFTFSMGYRIASWHYEPIMKDCQKNQEEFNQLKEDQQNIMYQIQLLNLNYRIFLEQINNVLEFAEIMRIEKENELMKNDQINEED